MTDRMLTRSRARHLASRQSSSSAESSRGTGYNPASQVPLLILGTSGSASNFSKFRDAAYTYLTQQYGLAARVLVDNKVPKPPIVYIDQSDDETDSNAVDGDLSQSNVFYGDTEIDPVLRGEIRRLSALEAVKTQHKESNEIRKNLPKIYAFIWERMSHESKAKVRDTAPDFEDIEYNSDIVRLWQVVKDTHLVGVHQILSVAKSQAYHRYYKMEQGSTESLSDFKRRMDDQLLAMKSLGIDDLPQDVLAADLISKLHPVRWGNFQISIQNGAMRGYGTYPATLNEAYEAAKKDKLVPSVQSQPVSSSAFHTNSSNSSQPQRRWSNAFHNGRAKRGNGNHYNNKRSYPSSNSSRSSSDSENVKEDGRNRGGFRQASSLSPQSTNSSNVSTGNTIQSVPTTGNGPLYPVTPNRLPPNPVNRSNNSSRSTPSSTQSQSARMMVCRTVLAAGKLNRNDILLDNQATQSIFSNRTLLDNISKINVTHVFEGVAAGNKLRTNVVGQYCDFRNVFYHSKATANLLSMSDAAKYMKVSYNQSNDSFVVTTDSGNKYTFTQRNGLYIMSHNDRYSIKNDMSLVTVSEKESQYSQRQIAGARKAHELMRILGLAHPNSAIRALSAANNNPCTLEDFRIANEIYGPPASALRGSTVRRQSIIVAPATVHYDRESQTLHIDILQVNNGYYLLSASTPLGLLMISYLGVRAGSKTTTALRHALEDQLSRYRAHRFDVRTVLCDGEGGFTGLRPFLADRGVVLNVVAAGQHVPYIERRIREVKEHARGVYNSLPYTLPECFERYLLESAVYIINLVPHTGSAVNISPREIFSGYRINVTNHIRIAFGDYAEITNPYSNNSMTSRTDPAIAVGYIGNYQGSVRFFSLLSNKFVSRDQFRMLPTTQFVINRLNRIASRNSSNVTGELDISVLNAHEAVVDDINQVDTQLTDVPINTSGVPTHDTNDVTQSDTTSEVPDLLYSDDSNFAQSSPESMLTGDEDLNSGDDSKSDHDVDQEVESSIANIYTNDTIPMHDNINNDDYNEGSTGILVTDNNTNDDNDEVIDEVQDSIPDNTNNDTGRTLRSRYRGERKYYHHITGEPISKSVYDNMDRHGRAYVNISVKEGLATMKDEAEKAIRAELQGMLDRKAFHPVKEHEYRGHKLVRSFMFLKEKFHPDGSFDKLKARLVANGSTQDRLLYDDQHITSPTVSIIHVFTISIVAVFLEEFFRSIDVPSAFIRAANSGPRVFMILDHIMTTILILLRPDFTEYVHRNGTMVVEVDMALYGLIQSPKLWFQHLSNTLMGGGFVRHPIDECVFMLWWEGFKITVAVYVDDLLITYKSFKGIEYTTKLLQDAYGEVTIKDGNIQSYLGMCIDTSVSNEVTFTMPGYIDNLIKYTETTGVSSSPAGADLFTIDSQSIKLDKDEKKKFHTSVAKVLYLAKRVRPDLLTCVSFLASRVLEPTVEDLGKLVRMLKYINTTKNIGMKLCVYETISVICSIDASYGVHPDGRGHAGMVISLGGGPLLAKSTKIKIVTKSSCESELMAVTEHIGEALSLKEFLHHLDIPTGPVILLQDNMSTIHMIKNGRGTSSKSKHIDIRNFWITDRVKNGDIEVRYQPTDDMDADILSKPLVGEKFTKGAYRMLNWNV